VNLDVRTMMFIMAGINLLFACLLALVGKHAGPARGPKQWALAELCFGIGLGMTAMLHAMPPPWMIGLIAALLALGIGLRFNGIQAFKGQRPRYWIPVALIALLAAQSLWFSVVRNDPQTRIVANWLVLGLANGACALALFVRVAQPLRTAYWLAGASFVVMSIIMILRSVSVAMQAPEAVGLFAPSSINPTVFLIANLAQASLSCSLVLMINYRLAGRLTALAATDSLTGLLNRRSLTEAAVRLSAYAQRNGRALSILIIDIDHFKRINDEHGHPAGDAVLCQLATLMQAAIRSEDYLARIGGEEFCILLPSTSEAEAAVLAERLRAGFAQLPIAWEGVTMKTTISIGIADSLSAGADLDGLMAAGDRALYRAKNAGRDRVALYSSSVASLLLAQSRAAVQMVEDGLGV
jgi:diguanylate cyclase (GGDEF)-like protein